MTNEFHFPSKFICCGINIDTNRCIFDSNDMIIKSLYAKYQQEEDFYCSLDILEQHYLIWH